ncbi:hypothetical protein AAHA92_18523 [Salvia divinorum]|uniref:Uncharacterized protein n=1 Tax=Salvia divinorum TaxID=28513 RepID=A0ABD1H2D9_SALDI
MEARDLQIKASSEALKSMSPNAAFVVHRVLSLRSKLRNLLGSRTEICIDAQRHKEHSRANRLPSGSAPTASPPPSGGDRLPPPHRPLPSVE